MRVYRVEILAFEQRPSLLLVDNGHVFAVAVVLLFGFRATAAREGEHGQGKRKGSKRKHENLEEVLRVRGYEFGVHGCPPASYKGRFSSFERHLTRILGKF